MIYNHADEIPDDTMAELIDCIILVAQKLREWRDYGSFHELRAQILAADGPVAITCYHDNRVSLTDVGGSTDITELVDRGHGGVGNDRRP